MTRERLPDRRGHEVVEFLHRGIRYTFGIGRYDDRKVAEVFVCAAKSGADAHLVAHDAAVTISLLLQHGCPIETIQHALGREEDGSPQGPFGVLVDYLVAEATALAAVSGDPAAENAEGMAP